MSKNNRSSIKLSKFQFLRTQSVVIILIIVIVIFSFLFPEFLSLINLKNILNQISITGIIALGLTLLLINGEVDLSVGSLFALTGVMSGKLLVSHGILISIIIPLAVAVFVGFIHGYIITKFKLNSIIVTLGSLSLIRGIAYVYSGGGSQLVMGNPLYRSIGGGKTFGIPNYIMVFIILALVLGFVLHKTVFGRNIYLVGVNPEAARVAGIKSNRVKIILFIISSLCVAIAAILQITRLGAMEPNAGGGFEFIVITIVLVGGTSFFGGRGSIFNTIIGAALIGVLVNGMILGNISYAFQDIFRGFILLVALLIDVKVGFKG